MNVQINVVVLVFKVNQEAESWIYGQEDKKPKPAKAAVKSYEEVQNGFLDSIFSVRV